MGDGVSREAQISIAASSMFPGFRFSPTDDELISYYLKKKLEGYEECVQVISEIDICRYEPWDLPAKSIIQSDSEWFFFSPRGKKYPNGSQSKRATESGYWKATGKERNVKSGLNVIGTKRTLVFHIGRAPKGERTEWIMHEYCINDKSQESLVVCRLKKNTDFRLNDARASSSPRLGTTSHDSNCAVSDVGTDQVGTSEQSKGARCCSKRSASSNDSHSMEQNDSTSGTNQNLIHDVTLTDSSSQQKETDEEDCYAEILKDDIIKLDESSQTAAPVGLVQDHINNPDELPMLGYKSEHESRLQDEPQAVMGQSLPVQGTANRRIRLKQHKPARSSPRESSESDNKMYLGVRFPKSMSICTMTHYCVACCFAMLALIALWLEGGNR